MKIIHATDFSSEAEAAEAEAVRLARALGGEHLLVHVATESPLYRETAFGRAKLREIFEAQARWAEDRLAERARYLASHGITTGWRRRVGVPHEEILEAAVAERAAYIVIGTHGRGGVGRFMLGSVVDRVVRAAACPVVVVPPGTGAAPKARKSRATVVSTTRPEARQDRGARQRGEPRREPGPRPGAHGSAA